MILLDTNYLIRALIAGTDAAAQESASLFNAVGRGRQLRVGAMIAATAIVAGARLATEDADGFSPFVREGLRLT